MTNPSRPLVEPITATIASGQSVSADINLGGLIPTGIQMPATWTAASLTFQVSYDGNVWSDMYIEAATEKSVAVTAGNYFALTFQDFMGVRFLRLRSGTSSAAVAQGAERDIIVMAGRPSL